MEKLEEHEKLIHWVDELPDKAEVINLIHKDFKEIWYSWRTYFYTDTIEWLKNRTANGFKIHSQEYSFKQLAPDIIQVFYNTIDISENWSKSRFAKRMSLWKSENNHWQLLYHQATPTEKFEEYDNLKK